MSKHGHRSLTSDTQGGVFRSAQWSHSDPIEVNGKTFIDLNGSKVRPTLNDFEKSHPPCLEILAKSNHRWNLSLKGIVWVSCGT